ncbi:hypothetical protein Trydic_g6596 [Trypoxylus dichotomus]
MCQKSSSSGRNSTSTMTVTMAKITILLIVVYFSQNAAGSCLSYGHSCWGGHGKRIDPTMKNADTKEDITNNDLPSDARWFLNKFSPSAYKMSKIQEAQKELDLQNSLREISEFPETISLRRNFQEEEVPDYQDLVPALDTFYPEDVRNKALSEKLKFLNFLRSQKLN